MFVAIYKSLGSNHVIERFSDDEKYKDLLVVRSINCFSIINTKTLYNREYKETPLFYNISNIKIGIDILKNHKNVIIVDGDYIIFIDINNGVMKIDKYKIVYVDDTISTVKINEISTPYQPSHGLYVISEDFWYIGSNFGRGMNFGCIFVDIRQMLITKKFSHKFAFMDYDGMIIIDDRYIMLIDSENISIFDLKFSRVTNHQPHYRNGIKYQRDIGVLRIENIRTVEYHKISTRIPEEFQCMCCKEQVTTPWLILPCGHSKICNLCKTAIKNCGACNREVLKIIEIKMELKSFMKAYK
jgi:hypothetical protein